MGNQQEHKTNKGFPLRAAAVLLCLALFSAHLVGGMYAKLSQGATADNGARVAKFSIRALIGDGSSGEKTEIFTANMVPGDEKAMDIVIENDSEVAAEYEITISRETSNLPLTCKLKDVNKDFEIELGSDNKYIVPSRQLVPGENITDKYTLTIKWDDKEPENRAPDHAGRVGYVQVKVSATQID